MKTYRFERTHNGYANEIRQGMAIAHDTREALRVLDQDVITEINHPDDHLHVHLRQVAGKNVLKAVIPQSELAYINSKEGIVEAKARIDALSFETAARDTTTIPNIPPMHFKNEALWDQIGQANSNDLPISMAIWGAKQWAALTEHYMDIHDLHFEAAAWQAMTASKMFPHVPRHIAVAALEDTWIHGKELAAWHQRTFHLGNEGCIAKVEANGVINLDNWAEQMVLAREENGELKITHLTPAEIRQVYNELIVEALPSPDSIVIPVHVNRNEPPRNIEIVIRNAETGNGNIRLEAYEEPAYGVTPHVAGGQAPQLVNPVQEPQQMNPPPNPYIPLLEAAAHNASSRPYGRGGMWDVTAYRDIAEHRVVNDTGWQPSPATGRIASPNRSFLAEPMEDSISLSSQANLVAAFNTTLRNMNGGFIGPQRSRIGRAYDVASGFISRQYHRVLNGLGYN